MTRNPPTVASGLGDITQPEFTPEFPQDDPAPVPPGEPDEFVPVVDDHWEAGETEDLGLQIPAEPPLAANVAASGHSQPIIPVAYGVPAEKRAENTPDPFASVASPPASSPPPSDIHPHQGVHLLYMVVTWLHLQFHLPFRACNALILVVLLILQSYGTLVVPTPLTTLPRIMNRLGVEPTFDILPICPGCLEVYPRSPSTPTECTKCGACMFMPATTARPRVPLLQYPSKSIQSQLADILNIPGVEAELDQWRFRDRYPNRYSDIFDGAVAQEIRGPDGHHFFQNGPGYERGPNGELRIGLTLGVDWFSYLRSQIAPSHTSCPISFSIANLPPHLRYRTANLLLCGIMPGPKEQSPDQCQRFMRVVVNELLRLWEEGFLAITPSSPAGRLIRVILICICCDKPAAHKLAGFGSHSHTFFCTRCWIKQMEKATPQAFVPGGFPRRTNEQQRDLGARYAALETDSARDDFVKHNATRWSEFARLPYFDLVRMVVIDPMHNLLLGLVKSHFYHIWVQTKILRKSKELALLHEILGKFYLPSYLGRLPALIGEPAGGSLTADQWMLLATVVAPIAIPKIWHDYMPDPAQARAQRAAAIKSRIDKKARAAELKKLKAAEARKAKALGKRRCTGDGAGAGSGSAEDASAAGEAMDLVQDDKELSSCLHPDDPANFMKLCTALRLLLKRSISSEEVTHAETLLSSYCGELASLYGSDVIRPNHHYAIHSGECVRDFGPLHEFWTFIFERLNKVLKSFKTNNHGGGELETTFFREFHRSVATSRHIAQSTSGDLTGLYTAATDIMFKASADDRGTVQALAREIDEARVDEGVLFSLSPQYERARLPDLLYHSVLQYISTVFPNLNLRSIIHPCPPPESVPLPREAIFCDYTILEGCRYHAANRHTSRSNSIVEAFVSAAGATWIGELVDIIHVEVGSSTKITLGHLSWFIPKNVDLAGTVWAT